MVKTRFFQFLLRILMYQKSSPNYLETLPAEVKSMIINALPDLNTLQSLVLASPCYHAMYANSREALLTEFTIRQLESRYINLFQPMEGLYLYRLRSNAGPETAVIDAVEACVKWTRRPKRFKLCVGFCLELLRLQQIVLLSEEGFPILDDGRGDRGFDERTRGKLMDISIVVVDGQFSVDR